MHLLLTLLFGLSSVAQATTGCNAVGWDDRHIDVSGCSLYYPAIHWLFDEGVASGVAIGQGRSQYQPTRNINRAEFTKLVLLASGVKNPAACVTSPFPDVPKDAWFAPYICEAKNRGIISGFPDGTFKPAIDVNFANASKILANAFAVRPLESEAEMEEFFADFWYARYTKRLLSRKAVPETMESYTQYVNRGEMAEMLYRLATGRSSLDKDQVDPVEGEHLGLGYPNYSAEDDLGGIYFQAPDAPYVFAPSTYSFTWFDAAPSTSPLQGYAFTHALQTERCTESGMFEHCKPVFADWKIGIYTTSHMPKAFQEHILASGANSVLYFGGKPGTCSVVGIEGEYTTYCFVDLGKGKTMMTTFDWFDDSFVHWDDIDTTPTKTQNAYFARIRKTMAFPQ